MQFSEKLKILMSIFRLSSITLARGIGVDPSLISRWRSGERVPASTGDISAFLSGCPMLPSDRTALIHTIGYSCENREETAEYITRWLEGKIETPKKADERFPVLFELSQALTDFFEAKPTLYEGPVNLWSQAQRGLPLEHETYKGNQGKRQAAINFFHAIVNSPRPTDIYLCTDGDNRWITESDSFSALWERCLHTLARNGHTIHRIHMGKIDVRTLLVTLQSDVSLYSTGRYFFMNSEEMSDPVRKLLFVAGGHAVMTSVCSPEDGAYTTLCRGVQDTAAYAAAMPLYLDHCTLLACACKLDNTASFAEQLVRMDERPGRLFTCVQAPGLIHLPENVLFDVLSGQLMPSTVTKRLDTLARRRELFSSGKDYHIELCPSHILDTILLNESCRISGAELGLPRDAVVSGEALLEMLKHMRALLTEYQHYSLYFIDDVPVEVSIHLKENYGCFFASSMGSPFAVYTAEKELLDTLSRWFEGFVKRDRNDAIRRIEEVISELGETI